MSKYLKHESTIKKNPFFWRVGMFLFYLYLAAIFPGTKLFGSFPMQKLCLYALVLHGAIAILISFRYGIYATEHFIWYGVFTLLSLISLILSDGNITNGDFHSVIICLVLTVFQSFFITSERSFKGICWCYILICLINTVILIADKSLVLSAGDRLGVEIGINPNVLATYLMYGIVYGIWLFLAEENKWKKLFLFIILALSSYPLILTGGRKFFLAPLLFMCICLFLVNSHKKNTRIKALFIIGLLSIALWFAIMNIPVLYNSLGNRFEGLLNSYTGKGEVDMSSQQREQLRSLAIQGWLNSPLWGNGFDTFKYYSRNNGLPFVYSHSNITELLYNGGIIQFVGYYWFFGMILWRCIKDKKMKVPFRAFCIAGIIMQIVYDYGGVSYNVYHSQLFLLIIYCSMNEFKKVSLISNNPNI